ncbi:Hsp20/alpha crystallin family protein [Hymenobacter weizhouensis]|uniref:Hsp20/alpha crystallin family protein n=1 Tax=Hymenobacter sp. YIM 151500-1 TaxID=2987689 RepID=UPI002226515C|nr:Hsp20/alpha crystallin family protein [Hymenobacter sp. YIM 151500-1]UYZ62942.1 Hsp20/alpha crystallin family protein [Hymenobacter sp. YIM 151500-1]
MATLLYNNLPALRPSRAFNAMLNDMLRDTLPAVNQPSTSFVPQADVLESEQGYELHLLLPGVAKDSLNIDFQEGKLTVSGERKAPEATENNPKFRRVESGYGTFARSFRLPDTVDVTAIEAQLTDGVLHLTLPFDQKKVTKHQIEVR